ncbi:MAG TPA: hypothetical protein VHO07_10580 [Streptosporangiaceae bacterium]|jgi:hypothetical protein|nr:hypothetical protein [Streptosporangiaceae bacterium]
MQGVSWWGVLSAVAAPVLMAERIMGVAQAVWPLAVVLSCARPVRAPRGLATALVRSTHAESGAAGPGFRGDIPR